MKILCGVCNKKVNISFKEWLKEKNFERKYGKGHYVCKKCAEPFIKFHKTMKRL